MNPKTVGILLAAFGLVAAAVILSERPESSASAGTTATPPEPAEDPCSATSSGARNQADFGHGSMTAALSGSKLLQGGDGELYMAVDLDVGESVADSRQPLNVAIVIDRSGSMSGQPLARAKQAALGIIEHLSATDRVALVQYDHRADVLVRSTAMDAAGQARLRAEIGAIRSGGSTNLHAGMVRGRDEVQRELVSGAVNRVILLSDGLATAGITDTRAIARDARLAADRGVRITAVGLGINYNEDLMEAIADSGRGNYYYARDAAALAEVFAGEIENLQATVATGARLELEPICQDVEIAEVFGYEARRDGRKLSIPLADLAGGDSRKLVARLRAPVQETGSQNLVRVTLSFEDADTGGRKTAAASLGVAVTGDAGAVRASADKEVVARVVEVESAQVMREAASAYDRGDTAAAAAALRRGRARAEKKARDYDLEEEQAAPALDNLELMADSVKRYRPGSAGGRAAVKGAKKDARDLTKKKHK